MDFKKTVPVDTAGGRTVTLVGDAYINSDGVHFDGVGDYASIPSFDYYGDGEFTISFWFRKRCSACLSLY